MLRIIRNHNYLNGQFFSFLEYVAAAIVIAPFGFYFGAHGRWFYAIVAAGIALNALTVATVALIAIVRKDPGLRFFQLYRDAELRERVRDQHPNLMRETMILSIGVLVPFAFPIAALLDLGSKPKPLSP